MSVLLLLNNYQLQQNSMTERSHLQDALFFNQAIKMGYTQEDLQPINMEKIIQNSSLTLKQMSENQRQHYLQKKFQALQQRQNKIILSVQQAIATHHSNQMKKGFNPVIKKLLEDHEKRLIKKSRYDQKVRISKTRDAEHRKISNTIDLGRTSPNFSNSAKSSRVSKQSIKSCESSTSKNSHKDRLQLVRMKQKQAERYKKNLFRYNQNESRKKVEKVHESRLSLSRRLKTKSQISQQAVQQRKEQLVSLRHDQIRDHIEKLKYKMMKNEYIKQRQQAKRLNQSTPYDSLYKRQLKNLFEQNEKEQNKMRYQQKLRSVERKKKEIQYQKKLQMQGRVRQSKQKHLQALKFREYLTAEGQNKKQQTMYYETVNFERAKNQKNDIQSQKKMKLLEEKIKHEIVRSNFNSIQNKRKIQSQAKGRQMLEKFQQIKDIENIKRKLTRERNRNNFYFQPDQSRRVSFY